jgi:predicted AlkP superfamily pyrophosphatase or phosphodiesterase
MGHDISSFDKFRASALFQKYEAEALRAVVDSTSVGADEVTDLIFVNMKGPDYTSHAHGPDSKEQAATLAELDKQIAAYLALIDKKAGPGRSVTVITADHDRSPSRRQADACIDDVIAQLNKAGRRGRSSTITTMRRTTSCISIPRDCSSSISLKDTRAFRDLRCSRRFHRG